MEKRLKVMVGLLVGLGCGCSSGKAPVTWPMAGAAGATAPMAGAAGTQAAGAGAAGVTGEAGSAAAGAAGPAGTAGTAAGGATGSGAAGSGTAGTSAAGTGAAGTSAAGAGGTGAAGTGAAGTGAAGTAPATDVTKVAPTAGCGMDPGQALGTLVGPLHLMTMGTKDPACADSKCGPWMYTRDYWVQLPATYERAKAYPLLIEGPGCGGHGNNLYALPDLADSVIRVGLSPSADAQAFHSTNPGQGCFDDKEGNDSIDWVFYEDLYDVLAQKLCFDKNRVFAAGNSSGAWLANELGCKYAGDPARPVRAVLANLGGLPTDPKYVPTCSSKPLAGFWVVTKSDGGQPFTGNLTAIGRAMVVDNCDVGLSYATATFVNFPIGGGNADNTCKQVNGCPAATPLVICELPSSATSVNTTVVSAGFPAFLKLYSAPPLLTP